MSINNPQSYGRWESSPEIDYGRVRGETEAEELTVEEESSTGRSVDVDLADVEDTDETTLADFAAEGENE